MFWVKSRPLPENALLREYVDRDAYTDCYSIDIDSIVSHEDFMFAFYTTWIFKLERLILRRVFARPSSDAEASDLAHNKIEHFAAWEVERRDENQILLSDFSGRTRSWLMTSTVGSNTRLYFGSAIVPIESKSGAKPRLGLGFEMLLGFHKLYSRLLLTAAKTRLLKLLSADSEKTDS